MSINKDSQKAPNLRFKGFTDDWEQRKLGEVFNQTAEYVNPKDENLELWSVTVEKGLTPKTERYNREALVKKNDKFKTVKAGDIVYNPMNMTIGSVGFNNTNKTVAVSGYYVTMNMNQGYNSAYFNTWLKSDQAIRLYKLFATGTLIEKQRVQFPTLSSIKTFIPQLDEQTKIGSFLKNIDNTITLHQRKLEQLEKLKQALLQQMFPGKGETVPKLRFAGFEGDWEERKLSALFIKGGSGGTPKSTNKDFYEGNIPFLGISDITKSNGFINNTEKHISVDGLNNSAAWVVPRGSISLAMYASVGKVAVLNIDVATSQAFYNMVFDDDDLRDFVYQCLIKANELSEWNKLISTGTQANLNADKVKNFMLYLPQNHAEIKLISAFLKQFDTTIAIQQRKLDQLKNMKQVLLENMFI
ncbi:restriction endonuclease subunit S [Aerococcus agrisoli]|uniref:Restriction endonuclease subunit S n=1 Tax=Aerococcus agrisoli TaxID=2487350 RepID=A0A3N4G0T3_9LACT|nr:restriction endonuclease subunit S [Aerococcus agrisoli]RPA55908.1 restriction endonuclease subunit S [Aerococcus agrisoli]